MGVFSIKKFIPILLCLFLCGCSATYEVEIKDDIVVEKGVLLQDKSTLDNSIINNGMTLEEEINLTYDVMHDIENSQEEVKTRSFDLEKINTNNELGLKYGKKSKVEDYTNSPVLRQCYDNVKIDVFEGYINIYTSNKFNCFNFYKHLKEVKVVLTTPYVVKNANYDEVKGNKYYWYINKDNSYTKPIKLTLLKDSDITEELSRVKKESNWDYINYIYIVFGIIIVIIGIRIFIKIKKSNK